jgi:N-acetylneuraminic acid mutarotase
VTGAFEVYNPSTNAWTALPPMPTPRHGAMGVVLKGLFYVIGGNGEAINFTPLPTAEVYNPATNTWRTLSPTAMARIGIAGGAINGVIYATGGTSRGASGTYHEAYTP